MVDANVMIKNRMTVLQELKTLMLAHDAETEKLKRELTRMLTRKRAIPDDEDLARLGSMLIPTIDTLNVFASKLEKGFPG